MSLLPRRPIIYRPGPPPNSVLTEIVLPDFTQRFDACAAVSATIWGHGYRMCRTNAEHAAWIARLVDHMEGIRAALPNPMEQER